jgi:hypothetical protein
MSDFSMERLEPTARGNAVEKQPSKRDRPARPKRRPAASTRSTKDSEGTADEEAPHRIDSLA